ncbi:hypothetical protein MKK69_25330 [Methylobacterium sp. J-026]|nr:hypothetical protein [Methylobacterium sp. J-026]MCJ2137328.1 hypothetical protein [Methylobacterium sp. J-026]
MDHARSSSIIVIFAATLLAADRVTPLFAELLAALFVADVVSISLSR